MTATEQAQAWLQEQMGEGWRCLVETLEFEADDNGPKSTVHRAFARFDGLIPNNNAVGRTEVWGWGPDPMSAASACVAAWREATKAEREHADRLAAALKRLREEFSDGKSEAPYVAVGDALTREWGVQQADGALIAHDARRSPGEGGV